MKDSMNPREVVFNLAIALVTLGLGLLLGISAMGVACWWVTNAVVPRLTHWFFPIDVVTVRGLFIYAPLYVSGVVIAYGIALCVPPCLVLCIFRMIAAASYRSADCQRV